MSEATNSELIDALNLCCDHVGNRLPDGYEVKVNMSSDECTIDLLDPEGETVEFCLEHFTSGLNSAIRAAVEDQSEGR